MIHTIGNNLFALSQQLGVLCIAKNSRVALAESCTGGGVAKLLTDVPGSSTWFQGGVVVYSNLAKINLLGVDESLIKQHGAVSENVANAMAQGALHQFQADLAVSITGVAGPGGGTADKPVGMVCFALADQHNVKATTQYFHSGREYIRRCASEFAIEWMIEYYGSKTYR